MAPGHHLSRCGLTFNNAYGIASRQYAGEGLGDPQTIFDLDVLLEEISAW